MSETYREKKMTLEYPNFELIHDNGRWIGHLRGVRTLKSGVDEEWDVTLVDIKPNGLRCVANTLRQALENISREWHALDKALKGEQ